MPPSDASADEEPSPAPPPESAPPSSETARRAALWIVGIAVLSLGVLVLLLRQPATQSAPDLPTLEPNLGSDALEEPGSASEELAGFDEAEPQPWSFALGEEVWASPWIEGGTVYAGSDGGGLHALDRSTGEERWSLALDRSLRRRPTFVDGHLAVVDEGGNLLGIDTDTGRVSWRVADDFITPPVVEQVFLGAPDSGSAEGPKRFLFVGDRRGRLVAVDGGSGKVLWRRQLSRGAVLGEPVAALGRVVLPDSAGRLHAVEAGESSAGGSVSWSINLGVSPTAARVHGAVLYLVADGFLMARRLSDGRELWRTQTSEFVAAPPAVLGDRVLVTGGDGWLYAFDTSRGVERWRLRGDGYVRSPPAAGAGAFFFGAGDHLILALDPDDGQILWRFETEALLTASLAITEDQVFFGSLDGQLYSVPYSLPSEPRSPAEPGSSKAARPKVHVGPSFFDGTPAVRYTRSLPSTAWAAPRLSSQGARARLLLGTETGLSAVDPTTGKRHWHAEGSAVDGTATVAAAPEEGWVIYGDREGRIRALDLEDGKLIWEFRAAGGVVGPAAISGRQVLFGATDGGLYSLDLADGSALWSIQTAGRVGMPVVDGSMVFAPTCGGNVLAVDLERGRELWRRPQGPCVTSVRAGRGSVYAVDVRGEMVSIEPAVGGERWRYSLGAGVAHPLAAVHGTLYATTADGHVVAVASATGIESWRWPIGPRASSAPAVVDGILYAGSHDGQLYAINAVNGDELWRLLAGSPVLGIGVYPSPQGHRLYATTLDKRLLAVDLP